MKKFFGLFVALAVVLLIAVTAVARASPPSQVDNSLSVTTAPAPSESLAVHAIVTGIVNPALEIAGPDAAIVTGIDHIDFVVVANTQVNDAAHYTRRVRFATGRAAPEVVDLRRQSSLSSFLGSLRV